MTRPACSEAEFIELWRTHKSAAVIARIIGVNARKVHERRRRIERNTGTLLSTAVPVPPPSQQYGARHHLGIENGTILVFSDAHFWPGQRSTAFKGLLHMIKQLQPKAVICNGDAFDGASISRHPRIGWTHEPSVIQELKACEAALGEIEDAAKAARSNVKLVWPLGNHDARFENRLAQNAPQYEMVKGFSLQDHFPRWIPCWSCWPNEDVVVKHRYKGGVHATHNNTVNAGKSMVTGHLHSLKVTPFSDYADRPRWGVDTGMLADPHGPQFVNYLEDGPVSWRSGFAVLTFHKGQLLWPELVMARNDGAIEFRGQVINVSRG